MGFITKTIFAMIVALVSVVAYFHIQCENERKVRESRSRFETFNPDKTDCEVKLPFAEKGSEILAEIGVEYSLLEIAPCAFVKMLKACTRDPSPYDPDSPHKHEPETLKTVTVHDARKQEVKFHQTGFTLIQLNREPVTQDWRTSGWMYPDTADVKYFHDQMKPHIESLYPDVKKIVWTHNVVRGGQKLGDQPKALGPHLDYHPNATARLQFHEEFGPPIWFTNQSEANILMGNSDEHESLEFKVLLGVWKPLNHNPICDFPLAVMDARTIDPSDICLVKNTINFLWMFKFKNLAGGIAFNPAQKWYYYPFQTNKEVLVFHQYSKDKHFVNPHTSFFNRNCPKGTERRISVEFRCALYF